MFYPTDEAFEKKHYEEMLALSKENLRIGEEEKKRLSDELYTLLETYGPKDVEALTLWHNTQALYDRACYEVDRLTKARSKPFFGRIDFTELSSKRRHDSRIDREKSELVEYGTELSKDAIGETIYIGKVGISRDITQLEVIDWRAPIASAYYESHLGRISYTVPNESDYEIDLARKRTYAIKDDTLESFYDTETIANDELLNKYLSQNKKAVLGEIIATIQQEQNSIIRQSPFKNIIVQGAAGSGKTTVAMHRISYILYNFKDRFRTEDFYIVGSNKILLNYITGVLPDLDVHGISQMTMSELFVRLLYEDWNKEKQFIAPIPSDKNELKKGNLRWFLELESFCKRLEDNIIPSKDVIIEGKNVTLLTEASNRAFIEENPGLSIQSKIDLLNTRVLARLENELTGKEIKYTKEEKKELVKFYRYYFGYKKWTTSIYDIYADFLKEQSTAYNTVFEIPTQNYHLYDLAALAYLYKRVKETDPIVEASHIVIDEAQDFGMMAYMCLKYCVRKCTYTIMGDVAQNIHYEHGLNDWQDLIDNFLTGEYDTFELLQKSYRNTVEISHFANNISRHGTFSIYPVQPIIRHGNEPSIIKTAENDTEQMYKETAKAVEGFIKKGFETIAVIVPDEQTAEDTSEALSKYIDLKKYVKGNADNASFETGTMVLPVEFTKGLEFDCVILLNPDRKSFPADDANVKLLYVAATRALHELIVIHKDELTDIIAAPLPDDRQNDFLIYNRKKPVCNKNYNAYTKLTDNITTQKASDITTPNVKQKKAAPVSGKIYNVAPIPVTKEEIVDTSLKVATKSVEKYGSMPNNNLLRISSNIIKTFSIKDVTVSDNKIIATTLNATLIITIYAGSMVRITYHKNDTPPDSAYCIEDRPASDKFKYKVTKDALLVATANLHISINKSNGQITFCDKQRKPILSEKPNGKIIETKPARGIIQFDLDRAYKLYSVGMSNKDLTLLNNSAKYISHGQNKLKAPCILSSKGFGIVFASDSSVLSCQVASYGSFFSFDDSEYIDYIFFTGENNDDLIRKYDWIRRKNK